VEAGNVVEDGEEDLVRQVEQPLGTRRRRRRRRRRRWSG
jgi:hypothetical protein